MKSILFFPFRAALPALSTALIGLVVLGGCDSGEKMVDEVTGNRAVRQYHKSKRRIEKIAEQRAGRYESIDAGEEDKNKE